MAGRVHLYEDESVEFDVHHHLSVVFGPLLIALLLVAGWVAALVFLRFSYAPAVISGSALLLILIVLPLPLIRWIRTRLVITNRRIVYISGVLAKKILQLPLVNISDVTCDTNVLDRMIGRGDLIITAGAEGMRHNFFHLPRPGQLQAEIVALTDSLGRGKELPFRDKEGFVPRDRSGDERPTQPIPTISVSTVPEQEGETAGPEGFPAGQESQPRLYVVPGGTGRAVDKEEGEEIR